LQLYMAVLCSIWFLLIYLSSSLFKYAKVAAVMKEKHNKRCGPAYLPFHFLPLLHQYGKYKFYCLQHYYVFLLSSYFLYNHKSVFLLFLCVFFLQLKFILKLPFSLWLSQYHSILHVPNFLLMFLVFLFSLICSWSSICFYSVVAILS